MNDILVSNSSLVSGLSEASGVRFSWVEVSQESQHLFLLFKHWENLPIEGLLKAFKGASSRGGSKEGRGGGVRRVRRRCAAGLERSRSDATVEQPGERRGQ